MKTTSIIRNFILSILALLVFSTIGFAQTTEFTYQGSLNTSGSPATGNHDFEFLLFDSLGGGAQLGATLTRSTVPVAAGVFSVKLDFGNLFPGANRFLEIHVRQTGGGAFTPLTPRQQITSTPYAIYAASTGVGGGSPWLLNGTSIFYNGGNVGIGTAAPTHTVHIASPGPTLALQDTDSTTQQVGYVSYRDSANVERAWVGYGTAGDPDFSVVNARPGGDIVLLTLGGGNVGIGTATPQARLDVRGDVKLGSSGQLFATGGEENLRIIRGVVTMDPGGGTPVIAAGSGFQVTRNGTGRGNFHISFNTPFAGQPAITAIPRESITGFVGFCMTDGVTSSGADIHIYLRDDGSFSDKHFEFIAIGPR